MFFHDVLYVKKNKIILLFKMNEGLTGSKEGFLSKGTTATLNLAGKVPSEKEKFAHCVQID